MRGVYHRAGQRPDPVAYCALRATGSPEWRNALRLLRPTGYRTASITLPTLPNISPISSSLTINGGLSALVSPGLAILLALPLNALSLAAPARPPEPTRFAAG